MFLGIDLGTSGVKALIIDETGAPVAQATAALTVQRPQPSWSEQDPEDWWRAVQSAVAALPAESRRAVRGIGLSGQMHGAVLLDEADAVLRPAILWNDGRSEAQCAELERREPRTRTITGNRAMPGFTAPKLLWVRAHERAIFERTATVLLPKDYLRLRLTGSRVSDLSDAAGTLWLDVGARAWSDAMLSATDLTLSHMPALVEGSEPSGRLTAQAAALFGMERVVVAGGGGDNAASAVGSGIVRPGQALLSVGTSGVMFVVTDRFLPNPARAAHAFCHALPGRWHQMSVMLSAASALDWAVPLLGFSGVVDALRAAQNRGARGIRPLFLPYLSGERTPHNDARARGVFFGLSADSDAADLVHAVLDGVALAFADGMDTLLEAGSEIGEISAVGGGSRLTYWLRVIASALQRPLARRSGAELGAAFGAALLGRLAATGEDPLTVCHAPPVDEVIEPDAALAESLRARRPLFKDLYRNLQPLFQNIPP